MKNDFSHEPLCHYYIHFYYAKRNVKYVSIDKSTERNYKKNMVIWNKYRYLTNTFDGILCRRSVLFAIYK